MLRALFLALALHGALPSPASAAAPPDPAARVDPIAQSEADELLALMPPAHPTVVTVGLKLAGLTRVDPPSESFPTFGAELLIQASWADPRLAFDPATTAGEPRRYHGHLAELKLDRIWSPELVIENEEGSRVIEHREVDVYPDGAVRYTERSNVRAHAEIDLRRFPFDTQRLHLWISPFSWDAEHVELVLAPDGLGFAADHSAYEWTVQGLVAEVVTRDVARLRKPAHVLEAAIIAERIPGFYLYKLLLPLTLIVVFTWSAFWMRAEPSAGRMQRTFVALLTVVAFHHIVAGHLPRIGYLTFVDAVVYTAFLSVGATLVQVVRIHNAQHAGDSARVERLERAGRWGHPLGFATVILVLWIVFHAL
jgi:hypothetical protein